MTKKTRTIAKLAYSIETNKLHHLKVLNVSHNNLEFLPLEELKNIQEVDCSWNNLSAMCLPRNSLVRVLRASNNKFVNIMHSLCGNLPQKCLEYIDVSGNYVEDLILGNGLFDHNNTIVDYNSLNCEVFPRLAHLNCNNNYICFISRLPHSLRELHLGNNNLTIDRLMAKHLAELCLLRELTISGNSINC